MKIFNSVLEKSSDTRLVWNRSFRVMNNNASVADTTKQVRESSNVATYDDQRLVRKTKEIKEKKDYK